MLSEQNPSPIYCLYNLNPILDRGSLLFHVAYSKDKTMIIDPKVTDQAVEKSKENSSVFY